MRFEVKGAVLNIPTLEKDWIKFWKLKEGNTMVIVKEAPYVKVESINIFSMPSHVQMTMAKVETESKERQGLQITEEDVFTWP